MWECRWCHCANIIEDVEWCPQCQKPKPQRPQPVEPEATATATNEAADGHE
jgi:hypothetical protein